MKASADDIGVQSIDQLIVFLNLLDQALNTNDRPAVIQIMGSCASLSQNIMQHVQNEQLKATFGEKLAALAPVMQQVQQGADLSVLVDFINNAQGSFESALNG